MTRFLPVQPNARATLATVLARQSISSHRAPTATRHCDPSDHQPRRARAATEPGHEARSTAPIPGTTKLHRVENLGTTVLTLIPADLAQLDEAAAAIEVVGDRYNPRKECARSSMNISQRLVACCAGHVDDQRQGSASQIA
jgi:hypothetical protein